MKELLAEGPGKLSSELLESLLPEKGRGEMSQEGRELEKRSCPFCHSVCSASSPAPSFSTPQAAAAKGHILRTPGLGELGNRVLAKLRVIRSSGQGIA